MVTDTSRLRAAVFERTGIAIDEKDPIMAMLALSAEQTEEIGRRVLAKTSPMRMAAATAAAALLFGGVGAGVAWNAGERQLAQARMEWIAQQADPRRAALLASEEGKAGLELAELGVAGILAGCKGRRSWRVREGYCVPSTPDGRPDGFRVSKEIRR